MSSINNCTFSGNLGSDPETRAVGSNSVTSFRVAVSGYKRDEPPMWIKVDAWNKTGEIADKYLKKGSKVAVSGELRMDSYQNRGGETVTSPSLRCAQLVLLDSSPRGRQAQDDEIPF